ncbi:unnamed protein product [Rotaria magnacalcarata]|uniref:Uncharacterized protein n=1 Tax=Rotaria magnacalcarata TaxID=392030 RepID=A0A8S2WMF8_9BILA|nr:unnamed protein product [Rotaria magnacalcarata]
MLSTFAIVGLEVVSVVISPILGTLYAGFWCALIFTLSWVPMFGSASYSPLYFSQPLRRKVQILKAQIACAVVISATALLYMFIFISTRLAVRRSTCRVLIQQQQQQ